MTFEFELCERTGRVDQLDPHAWKAIATRLLARSGEGMAVCDVDLDVLFATPKAVHLLGRLGVSPQGRLPEHVATLVNEQLRSSDVTRIDRLPSATGGSAVQFHAGSLPGVSPANVVLFLSEESLRDDEVFLELKEKFSISRRGFQLAQLVRRGLTNKQIAAQLNLTESTVKVYLHQLYRDCRVSNRTSLIALIDRFSRPRPDR